MLAPVTDCDAGATMEDDTGVVAAVEPPDPMLEFPALSKMLCCISSNRADMSCSTLCLPVSTWLETGMEPLVVVASEAWGVETLEGTDR